MSNTTKADLSLLKSYKSSFDNEKQRYTYNTYNTFSGGYISSCSDKYVQRMKTNLSYHYNFISDAYSKINTWWTNYNNDLECLENGLTNNKANSNGIKESGVVAGVDALPALSNLNLDSFYTFEERRLKGEELKLHYSQPAAPVTPLSTQQPRFSNNIKKDNSKWSSRDYEAPVVKEAWYKKVGKGVMDFGSAAWGIFESGIDLAFTGIGNGLTYAKTYVGCGLGQSVSFFRILGGDLTWKDVEYANRQAWEEANAEVRERNARHEAKVDQILNHAEEKRLNYTLDDYCETLPADVADVGYNFGKGVVGVGEKVRDSIESTGSIIIQPIYYGIGKANGLSNEEIKSNMTAQREETMAEIADDECQIYMFDDIEQSEAGQWVQEHSDLTDAEKGLAQGVGELAGELALSYAIGGAIASHGVSGVASFSTASKAIVAGEAMTPVSMGISGAVTGYGSGIQEAYSDGAGYWEGIGYASLNAAIEGGSMAAGGATNKYVFRAGNMGAGNMFKGSLSRITIDTGCGVTEGYARILAHGIYKRKEDGSLYSVDELYEMYGGDEAIQQQAIMAFGGSILGETVEMRQAYKLYQMENAIASGDPAKLAKKMNNMKPNDFADYMKFAKDADVDTLLKNVDNESIKQIATIPDSSVLKKLMSCADADQKKIFVNSLTDSSAKELLKDIPDEMLEDVIKNADADSLTMIVKNANSKEMVESIADIYEIEYKKQIDNIVYASTDDLAANVDNIKRTIDLDNSSKSKKERYFETLNYGERDFGVDQNALTKYIPTVNNEEFKIIANDPRFYDLWYEDAVKLNPNIKVTRELSDSTVESLKNSGYTYSSQVNRTRRVLLQIYDGDQEKVLDQMKKLFDYKYSEDIMRLKNKPEFINMKMNDFEKVLFFANNPEGICDYAALCNSIFDEFKNKPNAFKEVFGYDMYTIIDGKKHLNSDELLLDLYTSVNSKNISSLATFYVPEEYKHRFIFNDGQLSIVDLNQRKNALGRGLGYDNTIINEWLASKGSNVKVKIDSDFSYRFIESNIFDKNMTADEVKKLFKKYDDSSVIIGINKDKIPLNFYDENGNIYLSTHTWSEGAGHAVYLTDITDDGIIVSSWGKKLKLTYEELSKTGFYTYDVKFDNIKTDDLFSIESLPSDNKLARRNQYNILKNKLDSGIELTADEKVLLSKLSIETEIDKININERISTTMEEIEKLKKKAVLENNDEKLLELTYKLEEYKKINDDLESLKGMLHKNNIYDIKKLDHDHAVAIGLIPKDLKPENQDISIDIKKYLDDKVNEIEKRAKKFEPEVFSDLREFETEDLVLINEDYRIKSSGSISEKLLSDAKKQVQLPIDISYKDIDEAADKMKDSLRGTFISNPDNYKENVIKTVSELKDKGYKVIKVGNSWGSDSKYQGINVGFVKEINGEELKLEVQFHTFDSFVTKEGLTHTLYEVARNDFVPDNIRTFANDIQCKYQKLVVVPDGAKEININLFNK